jgi:hypothetical protein
VEGAHPCHLHNLPTSKGEEQAYANGDAEERPEVGQAARLDRRNGQVLHHALCEAIVFNLLLSSLLEEFLYHDIVFIGHNHFVLNRLLIYLFLSSNAISLCWRVCL